MGKQKITIEYPLSTKSPTIVWSMISDAAGLQKWIADYVEEADGKMLFKWGEVWTEQDAKTSVIISREKNMFIRMRWDAPEYDESTYWEMRIDKSDLTGHLNLVITDFADHNDVDYLKNLWNDNLNRLHNASGLLAATL